MLQIVRRLHNNTLALVGVPCSMLCDEIGSLAAFYESMFISAGGCFGVNLHAVDKQIASLQVVPGEHHLADVYYKVVRKFGQVTTFQPFLQRVRMVAFLSVRPSVHLSVRFRCFVEMNKDTIMRSSVSGSTIVLVSEEVKFVRIFAEDHPQRGR